MRNRGVSVTHYLISLSVVRYVHGSHLCVAHYPTDGAKIRNKFQMTMDERVFFFKVPTKRTIILWKGYKKERKGGLA